MKTGIPDRRRIYKLFILSALVMAERVGFEPTCRLPDKSLSRRSRYDHFGTSPQPPGVAAAPKSTRCRPYRPATDPDNAHRPHTRPIPPVACRPGVPESHRPQRCAGSTCRPSYLSHLKTIGPKPRRAHHSPVVPVVPENLILPVPIPASTAGGPSRRRARRSARAWWGRCRAVRRTEGRRSADGWARGRA